jgi:hypothetical protein
MIEPAFNMDINVSNWFRVGFGIGYRVAMGLDTDAISNSDISGPSGSILLKFGIF